MAKNKKKEKSVLNVVFVLDETGSMESVKETTLSGFNEYIDSLKKKQEEGGEVRFTLVLFNSGEIRTVFNDVLIKEVIGLNNDTYIPNNLTPLYDAVGKTIRETESRLSKGSEVLFVTMTDGHENSSKEYNQALIFNLIKTKEIEDKWIFAFMGANQDSWATGNSIGLSKKASTMNYSQGQEEVAFRTLTEVTFNALRDYSKSYRVGAFSKQDEDTTNSTSSVSRTTHN